MTKEIRNLEILISEWNAVVTCSVFGFRHSFGLRHSSFVISQSLLLREGDWRKRSPSPRPSPPGEGEARTVPGIFTPFGVELLHGDSRRLLRGSGGGDRRRQGRVLRTLDWQTAPRAWPEDGGGFSLSPGERAGVRGLLSRFNRHSEFPMVGRSQRNFLRRFP